ncbi:MAG: DsbA family protein, partial [Pseudomonadota bacterium]
MINNPSGLIRAALAAVVFVVLPLPASALDESEKEELGQFIREYLIENPEILFEVQAAYEAKQQQIQLEQARQVIAESKDAIFNSANDIVMGNPDGDVTIVEFFD